MKIERKDFSKDNWKAVTEAQIVKVGILVISRESTDPPGILLTLRVDGKEVDFALSGVDGIKTRLLLDCAVKELARIVSEKN